MQKHIISAAEEPFINPEDGRRLTARLDEEVSPGTVCRAQTPVPGMNSLSDVAKGSERMRAELRGATGMSAHRPAVALIEQVARCLPEPAEGDSRHSKRIQSVREELAELEPETALEGCMSAQMLVTQATAFRLLETVNVSEYADRHPGMHIAVRLLNLVKEQTLALARLKHGGRQTVKVIREEVVRYVDDAGRETSERRQVEIAGQGGGHRGR